MFMIKPAPSFDRASWAEPEINKLHAYIQSGTPAIVIAELLERSEMSVRGYCYRNQITLPRKC